MATHTTKAALTFQQMWHAGVSVVEVASPHRRGTVITVQGTGVNARILVYFAGYPSVWFHPAGLSL